MVPLGTIAPDAAAEAGRSVSSLFACDVDLCAPLEVPAGSFDTKRRQYSSVAFMLALAKGDFGPVDRVLGLTTLDLFIPMLTFVFGQAQLGGRCALVSLARLGQQFYGGAPDPELLNIRLKREIGHELGHAFGLIHCPHRECLMSLATSIQDVDRRSDDFCPSCRGIVNQKAQSPATQELEVTGSTEEKNESQMADISRR
jgi:archaemetzincin